MMIRVNLAGSPKARGTVQSGLGRRLGANGLPLLWLAVILGTAVYGYTWFADLSAQTADLAAQIFAAEAERAQLQSVIDESSVYEARREMLLDRLTTIEGLQRDQVSPVVLLDRLSDAISRTEYVWLQQLQQDDTVVSLAGIGTSVNAIADFVSNLEETGYFTNINLVNAQDTAGTFSFQMICDFLPPPLPGDEDNAEPGAN